MDTLKFDIENKEKFYFFLKVIFGLVGYSLIFFGIYSGLNTQEVISWGYVVIYILIVAFILYARLGIIIGYLRGNAIRVTNKQFPDIFETTANQCKQLGLNRVPNIYILQSGGFLNAFATRFSGSNYIILYSDIVEEAYATSVDSLEFIIGHELGHIKRKHLIKSLIFFPSLIIPFLNKAYSRACEYTCDNIGARLNPVGASAGLLILASGKSIWQKVDVNQFMLQAETEKGFWAWFAEKLSTHPCLTKRIIKLKKMRIIDPNFKKPKTKEVKEIKTDHSNYMPSFKK